MSALIWHGRGASTHEGEFPCFRPLVTDPATSSRTGMFRGCGIDQGGAGIGISREILIPFSYSRPGCNGAQGALPTSMTMQLPAASTALQARGHGFYSHSSPSVCRHDDDRGLLPFNLRALLSLRRSSRSWRSVCNARIPSVQST